MSQFFIGSNAAPPPPQVPTSFPTNAGTAVPVGNVLNIFGTTALAGSNPLSTTGVGNTVTVVAQISQAIAGTDSTKIGLSAFNSAQFVVDANGFVSTNGATIPTTITGQSGGALSPIAGNWNIFGGIQIPSSTPVTTKGSGNTLTVTLQYASAIPGVNTAALGLAAFNSAQFSVTSGYVSILSSAINFTITGNTGGALSPTAGNWNILGNGVSGSGTSTAGNIFATGSGSTLTINSTQAQFMTNYTTTNNAASPYTVLATDYYISVDASGGVVTIKLPNAPTTNRLIIIKDKNGNSATNNISITTVGGAVTIDGQTTYTLNSNYSSVSLLFNGTSYEVF